MARRYWLVKTEPSSFSIDDLARSPQQTTCWDGVRNYQARNFLRDQMSVGDGVAIYHSRKAPMAVVGIATVVRGGFPDASQFDPNDEHFDPQACRRAPRWFAVDLRLTAVFARPVVRAQLVGEPELIGMMLLQQGSRLSVQPVSQPHWRHLCRLGGVAA